MHVRVQRFLFMCDHVAANSLMSSRAYNILTNHQPQSKPVVPLCSIIMMPNNRDRVLHKEGHSVC